MRRLFLILGFVLLLVNKTSIKPNNIMLYAGAILILIGIVMSVLYKFKKELSSD